MAFFGNVSKNTLYFFRAAGIGALGAAAYIYLKRNKKNQLGKPQTGGGYNQPLVDESNAFYSKAFPEHSEPQYGVPLSALPMENRITFVKKIYGLLCGQLAAVGVSTALAFRYARSHRMLFPFCIIGSIGALASIVAMHTDKVRTNDNLKKVCLGAFTVSEMMALPLALVQVPREIVMSALLNTGLIVGGLTGYAHVTKRDYSPYSGLLTGLIFGLLGTTVLFMFFPARVPQQLIAWAGAGIFSFALVQDTQRLLGKGQCRYNYGDYDIATVGLYLNIINIFLYMISIMGNSRRK
eukprot:TRINITY_DN1750_c0_g1_i9.p1 TRINITY_DN1750_c0_g1~~TRINITY_DN1750_c0_g1_i9.p1  ORF type:complete len:295 (+),score=59.26 TRINITY_DN1750_c0_g1_i9:484-1368(+)